MLNIADKKKSGGLAGIIAGKSAICTCGKKDETLRYWGYAIEDLAAFGTFEEVSYLLLREKLPKIQELIDYKKCLKSMHDLPKECKKVLELIPKNVNMMDVLRTGCSFLGLVEPEKLEASKFDVADRLIASFPSMLMYWYNFHHKGILNLNTPEDTIAGHFLYLLNGESPDEISRNALDISLILYAEHEFNASTFTARTIASTLPDFYSAVTGAIGALRGPLHGGANEEALRLIQKFDTPENAEKGLKEMLNKKDLIMGFGHRVYSKGDPRSPIIKKLAQKLAEKEGKIKLYQIAERLEAVMWDEKKLFPNLDFYSAVSYYCLNIPSEMFTPLFVISRMTGWAAHILEQRANNKLIRPLSEYTGPDSQKWQPLEER